MRRRFLRSLLGSCLLISACAACAQEAAKEELHVLLGFTSPLSGTQGVGGTDALNGARMAIERINRQDMRIGGQPARFELLVKDDRANPERGMEIAQEFAQAKVSAVLGPFNSSVAMAAAKIYNQRRVPILTVASNPAVTRADYDYVFRLGASDGDMGRKLAQYAARTLRFKHAVIVNDGSDYAAGLINEFQAAARLEGLQTAMVFQLSVHASDPEVRGVLGQIREAAPDAVFFAGYVPQAAQLLREMSREKMDLPMLAGDAQCSLEMFRLATHSMGGGVYCVQGGVWLTRVADGAVFSAAYQNRYGRPPDVYAASFYDGVMLLAQAMKTAGSAQPEKFVPVLARGRYKGITATYEFDAKHDLKDSDVTILRLKDGALVPLASF
ncbi:branched-chain amino acid ABC transporter substrate-binding protein [Herbaspirillum sp. SJZ099]|uniref:branched-chain amino acid ABC transporter substrate-binding protein n=1 Tax=Herbaspirillum sp. SJZ099 TaxID=2572916 RepID=UPI00119E453A|nr:branched-chain amino acid ABC transporter substrate-binding protein [Herbaspirillum sp. SJZ099]TWC65234.1 amino acid/amide ABC transporter substrate-binding protein (HAAT family) [Herbaspirillum sp. SJZ099]